MTVEFEAVTEIGASPDVVFDLSLDIDEHLGSMADSGERAIAGVTSGKIGLGEEVTCPEATPGPRVESKFLETVEETMQLGFAHLAGKERVRTEAGFEDRPGGDHVRDNRAVGPLAAVN
jgi:hypothetical protein